jgi:hypothetical protein
MRNTALLTIPVPGLDDPPNVPLHLGQVADQVETFTVPRFATVAERDAKWPAPPNGALCITLDTYTQWLRRAGAWEARCPRLVAAIQSEGPIADIGAALGDIPGMTHTFTALAGHRYQITGSCTFLQKTNPGVSNLYIATGANLNLATPGFSLALNAYAGLTAIVTHVPGAGSITYKLRWSTSAGILGMNVGPGAPVVLLIEDLGF